MTNEYMEVTKLKALVKQLKLENKRHMEEKEEWRNRFYQMEFLFLAERNKEKTVDNILQW